MKAPTYSVWRSQSGRVVLLLNGIQGWRDYGNHMTVYINGLGHNVGDSCPGTSIEDHHHLLNLLNEQLSAGEMGELKQA